MAFHSQSCQDFLPFLSVRRSISRFYFNLAGYPLQGLLIPECQAKLPKAKGSKQPLPEALLWLLLTSVFPPRTDGRPRPRDWRRSKKFPAHVSHILKNLPKTMHPMTQFITGVNASRPELVRQAYPPASTRASTGSTSTRTRWTSSHIRRGPPQIYRNVTRPASSAPPTPSSTLARLCPPARQREQGVR